MIEKGSHTTESDQSLLDALIKGEETAFEKIYKSYFALLRNYSASIVGDSEAALEIIQNIFVAYGKTGKISTGKNLCAITCFAARTTIPCVTSKPGFSTYNIKKTLKEKKAKRNKKT